MKQVQIRSLLIFPWFCMLMLGLLLASPLSAQTTKWVDQTGGSDANDGNTEATAYATLQFAIDNSTSGNAGTPSIINVKNGSYAATGLTSNIYSTATLISGKDYLTIQAVPGHNPVVKPAAGGIVSISIENSNHIVIDNIDSDQTTSLFDNWHVRGSSDLTVRNCTFEGGDDGIDFETDHTTALIEGNTFKNITTGSGDEVLDFTDGSYSDITIQDNTFLNNYRQITIFPPTGSTANNFVIRRNLMNGTTSQEAVRFNDGGGMLSNVTFENNVIMNSLQQGLYIKGPVAAINVWHNTFFNNGEEEIRLTGTASAVVIKNNIFHANGAHAAISVTSAFAPGPLAFEDFNLVYNTGPSTESGSEFPVTVFGANTITGQDPMFVSTVAGSEDLHLQDGSPALEVGTDLGVTDDIEKNSRPHPAGSNPDLGAYEKEGVADPCQLYALFANQQVTIARSKHSASKGDIHSNGGIYFQRGDPNTYYGNLTAVGNIKIDKEIKIDGDATAGGKITLDGNAKILGTKSQYAAVAAIPSPSLSYSAGGPNVTVAKKKTVSLAPGSYNNVIVNDGGTLKFVAGTYNLNRLETKDDENKLYFDVTNGPVILNIVSNLRLSEEVKVVIFPDGEDGSEKVTFNTMQSTQVLIGKESYVLGNIVAPNAEVYLAKNVSFRGAICAKSITIDRDVVTLHHSSSGTLPFQKASPDVGEEVTNNLQPVTDYELSQNYPNPFNPTTTISFALPEAGTVSLSIYNMSGQLVKQLVAREMSAGRHNVVWDATDARGARVASGVYLYVIKMGSFTSQRKLVLMK
ncbi:right-handed parallel beta-helix repeat-containing protein [bacterium]|nr:right-handed parallel beta-helix repeat-containing protein [bacterium]